MKAAALMVMLVFAPSLKGVEATCADAKEWNFKRGTEGWVCLTASDGVKITAGGTCFLLNDPQWGATMHLHGSCQRSSGGIKQVLKGLRPGVQYTLKFDATSGDWDDKLPGKKANDRTVSVRTSQQTVWGEYNVPDDVFGAVAHTFIPTEKDVTIYIWSDVGHCTDIKNVALTCEASQASECDDHARVTCVDGCLATGLSPAGKTCLKEGPPDGNGVRSAITEADCKSEAMRPYGPKWCAKAATPAPTSQSATTTVSCSDNSELSRKCCTRP